MVQEKGCDGVVAPDAERFGTIGAELTMLKLVADWGTLARAECIGWQCRVLEELGNQRFARRLHFRKNQTRTRIVFDSVFNSVFNSP